MRLLFSTRRLLGLVVLAGLLSGHAAQAQASPKDTVRLQLPEAEQRFVANNLLLLAQQYNVTAAQAQVVQALLFNNPTVSLEQNGVFQLLNRDHFRNADPPSEVAVTVQQLVSLGGRRRAAGRLAQQGAANEAFELADLLRNLRYQLRSTFYNVYFKRQSVAVYDREVAYFSRTVGRYQAQFEQGNVALKEVIRLKAFQFKLANEREALLAELDADEADLRVLLHGAGRTVYLPVADSARLRALNLAGYSEAQLADTAAARRADLQAFNARVQLGVQNVRLQRAAAVPDLKVGYVYDKINSYINNYHALTLGAAVPVFNRNQGNIQAAQAQVQASTAQLDQQRLIARTEVRQAWRVAQQIEALYRNSHLETFDRLIDGIATSYYRRTLSIVEFLDFYESYKNTQVQQYALRADRMRAYEQLNLVVGRLLFRAD
ncbi:TolC family protein [Hymenobacter sp. DH14]|uniref:TolC family protein n=1 Tax=Hymenobacter cyanobacteriorum TaxID=2926463 RepID=A0A9X1VJG9_9BACT|nr:TolC family protein [Hymenobacter cyanobacteriorum]MCI1189793.1 TolC family protein [Hymenobacter cyanobacteriorum]